MAAHQKGRETKTFLDYLIERALGSNLDPELGADWIADSQERLNEMSGTFGHCPCCSAAGRPSRRNAKRSVLDGGVDHTLVDTVCGALHEAWLNGTPESAMTIQRQTKSARHKPIYRQDNDRDPGRSTPPRSHSLSRGQRAYASSDPLAFASIVCSSVSMVSPSRIGARNRTPSGDGLAGRRSCDIEPPRWIAQCHPVWLMSCGGWFFADR